MSARAPATARRSRRAIEAPDYVPVVDPAGTFAVVRAARARARSGCLPQVLRRGAAPDRHARDRQRAGDRADVVRRRDELRHRRRGVRPADRRRRRRPAVQLVLRQPRDRARSSSGSSSRRRSAAASSPSSARCASTTRSTRWTSWASRRSRSPSPAGSRRCSSCMPIAYLVALGAAEGAAWIGSYVRSGSVSQGTWEFAFYTVTEPDRHLPVVRQGDGDDDRRRARGAVLRLQRRRRPGRGGHGDGAVDGGQPRSWSRS